MLMLRALQLGCVVLFIIAVIAIAKVFGLALDATLKALADGAVIASLVS